MATNSQLQPRESPSIISGPTTPWEFLGFSAINALVGLLSNANPIGFIAVPLIAMTWWYLDRQRRRRRLQVTGMSLQKEQPRSASGLILLISPYQPRCNIDPDRLADGIHAILCDQKLSQDEFDAINLSGSNLLPQIKAVEFHISAGTLRDVWLLPTNKSQEAADLLRVYLQWLHGSSLRFHCEAPVAQYDYESLFKGIEIIFQKSPYKQEEMVADITGGTKMMSVALAMACVPPKRRMQYMDMEESSQPIALDVDPILYGD